MISKTTRIAIDPVHYEENPVETVPAPEFMFVPGENTRCRAYELSIKEGEHVYLYQKIGVRNGGYFKQNMFAPCSGTYLGLEKHTYRNGKSIDFLKFQNDFKDERDPSYHERSDEEIFGARRKSSPSARNTPSSASAVPPSRPALSSREPTMLPISW